ncbi:MAG TPA: tyrosine-type recombinase/integrase [Alphaproteobacteria bacterium]|nr:tyrosine-type recombinase/integrase [Alphaproteobacteria bacterium]
MRAKITKRAVDAAHPNKNDVFIWDTETKGFGLKVTPAGNKIYVVQARLKDTGKVVRCTIGKHGAPWTPEKARQEAVRLLGTIASSANPNEAKKRARGDMTVSSLCDLYLAEGCDKKKPSTIKVERSQIERHVKPLLGQKQLRSLTRGDIERFMSDVSAGKTATDEKTGPRGRAVVRGGKGIANRTADLLASMLAFAANRGLRTDNPVRGVQRYRRNPKERFLSSSELAKLGEALGRAGAEGENPYALAAIRLLILTGCRKNEVLSLRWDWVDTERACLRLPDSKTGAKTVPLGAPALAFLQAIPRFESNSHVFPSGTGDGHFVGLQKVWSRVRNRAGLDDVRLHDLRHSFASVAVAGGDSLYLVGKVLGHRQARTTERYAHLGDDPVRAVADRTAETIAAAMNGEMANSQAGTSTQQKHDA